MIRNVWKRFMCVVLILVMITSQCATVFAWEKKSISTTEPLQTIQSTLTKCAQTCREAIAKGIVRMQFRTVAVAGAALGCTTGAMLLNHSLRNHPADLSYDSSTKYADQILRSSECKKIVSDFEAYVKSHDVSEYTKSGVVELKSTPDLYLSYNGVRYMAAGTKTDGVWTLSITFKDTYDFSPKAWEKTLKAESIVAAVNNYAVYAQSIQAIVPYEISVTVETGFSA